MAVNIMFGVGGFGASMLLMPATGDLGDAFRVPISVGIGIVAVILSGVVTAWQCMREQ